MQDIEIIEDTRRIRQKPADRDRPPDTAHADGRNGREQISERHSGAKRDNGQHKGHARTVDGTVESVEHKQRADPEVKNSYGAQIGHAHGEHLRLLRFDKQEQELPGKYDHEHGDGEGEQHHAPGGGAYSFFDPLRLFCPVVLGDKGGEGVAEILQGHVGKGVDLYGCREGCHNDAAEAVDKSLHHQDAQIHHRLLQAGQDGGVCDLLYGGGTKPPVLFFDPHKRAFQYTVERDADAGKPLRQDRRECSPRHAEAAG